MTERTSSDFKISCVQVLFAQPKKKIEKKRRIKCDIRATRYSTRRVAKYSPLRGKIRREIYSFSTDWITLEHDVYNAGQEYRSENPGRASSRRAARFCLITVDLFVSSFFPLSIGPH